MISYSVSGSTSKTREFLRKAQTADFFTGLERLAQRGVTALEAATPQDSGATAGAWSYEIESKNGRYSIYWVNTNRNGTANIAILLQYGHGTGTGGYVAGRDYINPALQPVFDEIATEMWRKVTG